MTSPQKQEKRSIYELVPDDEDGSGRRRRCHCSTECRLVTALMLNLGYTFAEIGIYFAYDSLAMLADGFHNLSDVMAIAIAILCENLKKSSQKTQYTFGVKRAEVLGGVLNGVVLVSLCFYIVCDAVPRLLSPPVVDASFPFIIVAASGVPINVFSACLFIGSAAQPVHAHSHGDGVDCPHSHGASGQNLNLWAIFLHNMGDALTSVAVTIIAICLNQYGRKDVVAGSCADGILLVVNHSADRPPGHQQLTVKCSLWDYLDPVVSILLAVFISFTVLPLLRKGVPLLLNRSPNEIDVRKLREEIERMDGVKKLHSLRLWKPDDQRLIASVVKCEITAAADRNAVRNKLRRLLESSGAHDIVIELEKMCYCPSCLTENPPGTVTCVCCAAAIGKPLGLSRSISDGMVAYGNIEGTGADQLD